MKPVFPPIPAVQVFFLQAFTESGKFSCYWIAANTSKSPLVPGKALLQLQFLQYISECICSLHLLLSPTSVLSCFLYPISTVHSFTCSIDISPADHTPYSAFPSLKAIPWERPWGLSMTQSQRCQPEQKLQASILFCLLFTSF